jgi:hypothetical protein
MRRIIEKVVTVVTTTTWKISWEPDTPLTDHSTDTDPVDLSVPEHLTSTLPSTKLNNQEVGETDVNPTEEVKFDEPSEGEHPKGSR